MKSVSFYTTNRIVNRRIGRIEIKGFTGGNRENEIRNRRITERRKKYTV